MDKQNETVGVFVGLGLGLLIGVVGIVGTVGAFGYIPALLVIGAMALLLAAMIASGVATWGQRVLWSRGHAIAPAALPLAPSVPITIAPQRPVSLAEATDAWRRVELFRGMTEAELERIQQIAIRRRLPAGEMLVEEGRQPEHLYVVVSGQIRLSAKSREGDTTVRIATAGDAVPVACLLDDAVAVTTARTAVDVDALIIPRNALLELCRQQPELGMHLFCGVANILLRRYRATLDELSGYGFLRSTVDLVAV